MKCYVKKGKNVTCKEINGIGIPYNLANDIFCEYCNFITILNTIVQIQMHVSTSSCYTRDEDELPVPTTTGVVLLGNKLSTHAEI